MQHPALLEEAYQKQHSTVFRGSHLATCVYLLLVPFIYFIFDGKDGQFIGSMLFYSYPMVIQGGYYGLCLDQRGRERHASKYAACIYVAYGVFLVPLIYPGSFIMILLGIIYRKMTALMIPAILAFLGIFYIMFSQIMIIRLDKIAARMNQMVNFQAVNTHNNNF